MDAGPLRPGTGHLAHLPGVPSRNGAAMSTAARRLARLEAEEWQRVHALTPLQWLEQGYVTFTTLLPDARAELLGLLYAVCDPITGHIDRTRLTPDQRDRAMALLDCAQKATP